MKIKLITIIHFCFLILMNPVNVSSLGASDASVVAATSVPEAVATSVPDPAATSAPDPAATSAPDPAATSVPEAVATSAPEAVVNEGRKFKIGFEFQEVNNLCDWAENMFDIQKQPIFTVSKGSVKLWEVVIDGKGIEFVTEPFSNEQELFLRDSIRTISIAFKHLCDLKNGRNPRSITFNHWLNGGEFTDAERVLMDQKDAKFSARQAALIWIQKGLSKILAEGGFTLTTNDAIFERIAHDPFKGPGTVGSWRQEFQPKVIIQHPLESTVSLIRNLFYTSIARPLARGIETAMPVLDAAIPITKADGLVFLHALTCAALTTEVELDDKANIKWIADRLKEGKQIDGKVKLNFLSRRPFSNMWGDIRHLSDRPFPAVYEAKMSKNGLFSEVTAKMDFVNYADKFYTLARYRFAPSDIEASVNVDLRSNVDSDFLTADAEFLLSKGTLATSVLRHMDLPIKRNADATTSKLSTLFKGHFRTLVESVENPLFFYDFDPESKTVQEKVTPFDSLSPPWFLDTSDSMGAYKDNGKVDLTYGEAIVEMRQIREINSKSVASIKGILVDELNGNKGTIDDKVVRGEFLVNNTTLLEHANALFSLLNKPLIWSHEG
jgi:hypothetical protein